MECLQSITSDRLENVMVLQPLSGADVSEVEFSWSVPRIIGPSPRTMHNTRIAPIAGKCFPDQCNRIFVISLGRSELTTIAMLRCHSATMMEWERIQVSGVPDDLQIISMQVAAPNVVAVVTGFPMKMHFVRIDMVHNRINVRWETPANEDIYHQHIHRTLCMCMYNDHKLFVYGRLRDRGSFTSMINMHRLQHNAFTAEPPRPYVMIVPDDEPMLPPLIKTIHLDMLRLLYNPNATDFQILVTDEDSTHEAKFLLHRCILKAQWELMDRLLHTSSGFKEATDGEMRCMDDLSCMQTLLVFVYSGLLCIEDTDIIAMIQVANKYQLQSLLSACEGVLVQMVDKDNCLTLLLWARKFFLKNLIDVAVAVYIRNRRDIDICNSVDKETFEFVESIRIDSVHAYAFDNSDADKSVGNRIGGTA